MVTSILSTWAPAEEARPISAAQLQKILKFVDTIGGKEEFPAPTAQNLGISSDPNQALPVTVVVTDNHKVYFCRSELNPADYIIWVRTADKELVLYVFDARGPEIGSYPVFAETTHSPKCWTFLQRKSRPFIRTRW